MNLQDIRQRMYSGIWAINPEHMVSLKSSLNAITKGDMDMQYISSASMDSDFQNGSMLVIPVCGALVKAGGGLSDDICDCLGICDIDDIAEDLEEAAEDPTVDTIILNFSSGGGDSLGIFELGQLIEEVGQIKSAIGYTATGCYSAAYWLAAKCNEFYCSPSSGVGAVGARNVRFDDSQANTNAGIRMTPFASNPRKFWFDPDFPMSEEEAKYIQGEVTRVANLFKAEVLANRDIDPALLEAQSFDGISAVKNNFADDNFNSLSELIENLSVINP